MTSPDVDLRRSVSKRLKYYFELRQLEDGFDLSGPECPRTDRPLTRAPPALLHGRLYDRSLKHYFNKPTVKQTLTQLEPTNEVDSKREKEIKESLIKYMRNYHYNTPSLSDVYHIHNQRNQDKRAIQPTISQHSPQHNRKMLLYEGNSFQTSSQPPHWFAQEQTKQILKNASRILVTTEAGFNKAWESSGKITDTDDNESEKKNGKSRTRKRITSPHHGSVEREMSSGFKQQNKGHSRNLSKDGDDTKPKIKMQKSPSPTYSDTTKHKTNEQSHSCRKMNSCTKQGRNQHGMLSSNSNSKRSKSATHDNRGRRHQHNMRPESCKGPSRPKSKTIRNCGTQTTGELLRNYSPSDQVLTGDKEVKYHVDVHTGKHSGAATKANISVVLIGENGRTKYLPLSTALTDHKIKFKKNQHDVFELSAPSVGKLERIRIGHTKKQPEYKWFVESVTVRDFSTSTEYRILCQKWLSGAFGDQETFGDFPVTSSCVFNPDDADADYARYNSEESYIAMVSAKNKSSDNTSELDAVASYKEENSGSLIVEAEEQKTEVDRDSNDGSSDDDETSISSELGRRDVKILVPSRSQNGKETATETKASEGQKIEVDDDSSDDDREIDVLLGHKEKSAESPVSPKMLQTVEKSMSDTENDITRLSLNESDDYTSDDSESDEDIDYLVSPAASNPKLSSLQNAIKAGNSRKVNEITATDCKLLSGQTDSDNYLVTNGANRTAKDKEGNIPLDPALKSKHVKIFELPAEKKGATGDRELMIRFLSAV